MSLNVHADRGFSEHRRVRHRRPFAATVPPTAPAFDDLTALAAELCDTPTAQISLLDTERQWFKSRYGLDFASAAAEESFCVHVLDNPDVLVIPDARVDARVAHHRSVRDAPHLRFYAGAQVISAAGETLGALCVADARTRDLTTTQRRQLVVLATQVAAQLEVRRQAAELADAAQQMRDTRRMFDGVLRHTDVLIYAKDVEGTFVMVNPAVKQAADITEDMVGGNDYDFFDPVTADEYRRNDQRIMATGQREVFTERILREDGSHRTYRSTKFPVYDDTGDIIGMAGVSTDVTDLETARAAHEEAETRLRTLVEKSPLAITVISPPHGALAYANPSAVALCGVAAPDDLLDMPALELFIPEQRDSMATLIDSVLAGEPGTKTGRVRLLRADGREIPVEFTFSRIHYAGHVALQAEFRDITADLNDREHLEHAANTDALTHLMNRRAWTARLESLIATAVTAGSVPDLLIAVIDIDHFKGYNDRHGHPAGDELLQRIARVLESNTRVPGLIARWGGEEFVVALPHITTEDAVATLEQLRLAMPAPQTCSIGYTVWTGLDDLASCITRADQALYAAKNAGRNRVAGFLAE